MTPKTAYMAMYHFLERIYKTTNSDELGALLGGMSIAPDGITADPAYSDEWLESVAAAERGNVDARLRIVKE